MLTQLAIRDVVLIEALDLAVGPGLTALTGETGAGKSIILDALGLATGGRADSGRVRRGAAQASVTAVFAPAPAHAAWGLLAERGIEADVGEDLVLRRQLSADGRSRAFVNDQPVGVTLLRELGATLVEVHGQHETVGLLDSRTHRPLLDAFADARQQLKAVRGAWEAWRAARTEVERLDAAAAEAGAEVELLQARLAELDRLDPRAGEEAALAQERALLGAAEKALAEIGAARDVLSGRLVGGDTLVGKLSGAARSLERARERALQAAPDSPAVARLEVAAQAVDRVIIEAEEAAAAVAEAAQAFDFEPEALERAEERLFALRAAARKLGAGVEDLPAQRLAIAERLRSVEDAGEALAKARAAEVAARSAYLDAAAVLSELRTAAGARLSGSVQAELAPLKLDRARFQVTVEPLPEERGGPDGLDRVEFAVSTNPGAPFGALGAIASGGELARFALALKAALGERGGEAGVQPLMIFDEVDQGVGGAVADAVGLRLRRLAREGQVLTVTHSPQVAARAAAHWRVSKGAGGEGVRTTVEALAPAAREEEIARMLAGAEVTDAARAAARALIEV